MNFKEFFKGGITKKEVERQEKHAQEMMDSQERSDSFDATDGEFQKWFLRKFPVTSDGTTADDYALDLILGRESRIFNPNKEKEKYEEGVIDETIKMLGDDIKKEHAMLELKGKQIAGWEKDVFILEKRIEEESKKAALVAKPAFANQDEFYHHAFSESDQGMIELKNKKVQLENKIESEVQDLAEQVEKYQDDVTRWRALRGELEEDQDAFEQLN